MKSSCALKKLKVAIYHFRSTNIISMAEPLDQIHLKVADQCCRNSLQCLLQHQNLGDE